MVISWNILENLFKPDFLKLFERQGFDEKAVERGFAPLRKKNEAYTSKKQYRKLHKEKKVFMKSNSV